MVVGEPPPSAAPAGPSGAVPLVKWAGGKRSVLAQLRPYTPPDFRTFYEPFFGGGAFFFALSPMPEKAVVGDANCELVDLYRAVRDDAEGVMAALDALSPHAGIEDYYYYVRDQDPATLSPVDRAARFIYLNKTCYNGLYRVNRSGKFNVPFGRYATAPRLYDPANVALVSAMLRHADVRCDDFEMLLAEAGDGDFAYLDPPYVPLSRTANFTKYTSGNFGEAEQRRLAAVIHGLTDRGCRVLLSNSDAPLVRELYPEPRYSTEIVLAPRNINSNATGRARIAELAILNFDPATGSIR
jgi:DNA adenine methylase